MTMNVNLVYFPSKNGMKFFLNTLTPNQLLPSLLKTGLAVSIYPSPRLYIQSHKFIALDSIETETMISTLKFIIISVFIIFQTLIPKLTLAITTKPPPFNLSHFIYPKIYDEFRPEPSVFLKVS